METSACFPVRDYNLAATLASGQAFRWRRVGEAWEGVIHRRWVRLQQLSSSRPVEAELRSSGGHLACRRAVASSPAEETARGSDGFGESSDAQKPTSHPGGKDARPLRQAKMPAATIPSDHPAHFGFKFDVGCSPHSSIEATTAVPQSDWCWLTDYLRLHENLAAQLATFPDDAPLRAAVAHCHGLRLLQQEPWECLASFILSSTKQIVQIQQCVALLCERFGEPVMTGELVQSTPKSGSPPGRGQGWVAPNSQVHFTFPTAVRLAAASEAELRACKIGFRARYLHAAARRVAAGELDLARIPALPLDAARAELIRCPGVGPKIADCALLFAFGFDAAFPIDVWVERALRQLYFPRRRVQRARIERFAATHFGPHAGLAQQYLFHYLRTRKPA